MDQEERLGRFLSLILRHDPEAAGIELDGNGWADVSQLLAGMDKKGYRIDFKKLDHIVKTNHKKRYSFNEDKTKIRANQGHSIQVDIELKQLVPPVSLYHGTARRFLDAIKKEGLKRQGRNYVHLSYDQRTAEEVGRRHGDPVLLRIHSGKMNQEGYRFYLSENGVWLTECVPPEYIYMDALL